MLCTCGFSSWTVVVWQYPENPAVPRTIRVKAVDLPLLISMEPLPPRPNGKRAQWTDFSDHWRIRPRADFSTPSRNLRSDGKSLGFSVERRLASASGASPLRVNPAFIRQIRSPRFPKGLAPSVPEGLAHRSQPRHHGTRTGRPSTSRTWIGAIPLARSGASMLARSPTMTRFM